MGLNKPIEAVVIVVLLAASVGQLPRLINTVRLAQLQILREAQSDNWSRRIFTPNPQH